MLTHLYIKNVALISEMSVEFSEGLNILSGETGAGKSIIIDSINFVLGEKTGKGIIKGGETSANVSAIISVSNDDIKNQLAEMSVEVDDDNNIMLSRSLNSSGKNVYKINNRNVTGGILKEVSSLLIDIHGQHEHQSLLNQSKHINLLDRFCDEEINDIRDKLAEHAGEYKEICSKIKELELPEDKNAEELYEYQINEIKSAKLSVEEEIALNEKKKKIDSAVSLKRLSGNVLGLLSYGDGDNARDKISYALSDLNTLGKNDEKMASCAKTLEAVGIQLEDVISDVKEFASSIDFSEEEAREVEERLETFFVLKRKYGNDINEILEYLDKMEKKLENIKNSAEKSEKLNIQKNNEEKEISKLCMQMSILREKAAKDTEKKVEGILHELGMENARFHIEITRKNSFSLNGWDRVEFMFSANFNQPPMPLSKIASGGEMSRVMLSLKNVLADGDSIDTFIFDEIDTGVSGRTAQQVAEKLAQLCKNHQILCITHLPQIAAMGDHNYLIEKETKSDKTQATHLSILEKDQVYREIARLIGGAEITDKTINAAKEMKEMADKIKKEKKK